jgi:uncharacterized membrane protein
VGAIFVIALGFALRLNPLLVVLAAALTSGLTAGVSVRETVRMLGELFQENRVLLLPLVLMMPAIGVVERYGLRERVGQLMKRAGAATPGRVLWLYQVVRGATSTLGMSIGNHASMVRPLVAPMAEGAAGKRDVTVRAHAAAAENVGNFFSDDIVVAVGALLMIERFFASVGTPVELTDLKSWSIPTALWVIVVGAWRFRRLDKRP